MRGHSLGWFRGAEYAKHGVQHFIALHFLERRQQHVGFSHGFGRGGCTVTALASCFFVPPVCYPRTANLHHTDAGLGDFSRGIKTGGIHAAPARQRLFTIIAVLRTSRISLIGSPIADGAPPPPADAHRYQTSACRFRIHQHGTAHGIGPVIIMCGRRRLASIPPRITGTSFHASYNAGYKPVWRDPGAYPRRYPRVGIVMT